jgi:hypothetical protein
VFARIVIVIKIENNNHEISKGQERLALIDSNDFCFVFLWFLMDYLFLYELLGNSAFKSG